MVFFIPAVLTVLFADILLKILTVNFLFPGQTLPLIDNLVHVTYVQNYGSAFGFFRDQKLFLVIAGVMICSAVIYIFSRSSGKDRALDLSFGLILGGSLGNLLNRIFLGYVIDYIDLRVFPVFNLADVAINVGVAVIIFEMVFRGKECIR